MFFRQASVLADQPLFLVKRSGVYTPMTWRAAAEQIQALSLFLIGRQVQPSDRVLILSENRPEWGVTDLATQSVGAWTVPIYPTLTAQDVRAIARDCQPVICLASNAEQLRKLLDVAQDVSSIRAVVCVDPAEVTHRLIMRWSQALEEGRALRQRFGQTLDQRRAQLTPDDTATLIYTSGTTGEPKGVMLSHRNFLSNVEACLQVIPVTHTDVHLSFLPLSHVFERMAGWYLMLTAGARVAYAENMDTIPQNMAEVHPTVMLGVPRFFEKLHARIREGLRQASPVKRRLAGWAFGVGRAVAACRGAGRPVPILLAVQHVLADRLVFHKLKARLGGRLRFFVSGGAPLSKDIGEFFYSAGVTIIEGYGLTETSPVIAVNRLSAPRFGSVGQPVPDVQVRVADDGEVLVRGSLVMQGYYNKPEATASVIVDGWFHTGDIGQLDREGYLTITDRKKDLIKTAGGKFVAPQKLENLFIMDPYISQAFVYGERQPYCIALIVPNAEQLRRFAKERGLTGTTLAELVQQRAVQEFYWERVQSRQQSLAPFEQVKKIAVLDQEFSQAAGELTPTLKTKRSAIAQRYAGILQSLYQSHE